MVALAFDTLTASKALREAGADQRLAEAIVGIVLRTTEMPDISHLATKSDTALLATKTEVAELAAEVAVIKAQMVTREEITELKGEVRKLRSDLSGELSDKLRGHTFATLAYMTALVGAAMAFIKYAH